MTPQPILLSDRSHRQSARPFQSYAGTSTTEYAHGRNHADSVTCALTAGKMPIPSGTVPAAAPIELHNPSTPLQPLELERELASHPDRGFVGQLIQNLVHGCRIGYHGPHFTHIAPHLPSAYAHSTVHVVGNAIAKECQANRMAGPYPYPPLPNPRCSGLGVVPKKDGSWRLIYHLSAPYGSSINDFISPECYSLSYCTRVIDGDEFVL